METTPEKLFAIIVDVGGTHIRFGMLPSPDASLQCIEVVECAQFAHLEAALSHYLGLLDRQLHRTCSCRLLCLALPGDVQNESVWLVNLSWSVIPAQLAEKFGCQVLTVNDFSAQAHAIPHLPADDIQWLRAPKTHQEGWNRAIIGPGTGLGVAALLPDGQVVESEGGHISFAPQSPLQQRLLATLWSRFPRVSAERLVSGPGLANIYGALAQLEGEEDNLAPQQITEKAAAGHQRCQSAIDLFTQVFGSVCGDLALAFAAKGGVYLSGGVQQSLQSQFDAMTFLEHFDNKGRYRDYCRQIPVARVLTPQPGLLGAASLARAQATREAWSV